MQRRQQRARKGPLAKQLVHAAAVSWTTATTTDSFQGPSLSVCPRLIIKHAAFYHFIIAMCSLAAPPNPLALRATFEAERGRVRFQSPSELQRGTAAVSYTHLTLPTILLV